MIEDKNRTKDNKLEFNTYCIFTEEKQDIRDTIGLLFKDYLENMKVKSIPAVTRGIADMGIWEVQNVFHR